MVTSEMGVEDMALVPNTRELAALDPQKFEAAQEWRLYRHVELTPGTVLQEYSSRAPEKPTVTCTVRVARRSGYFYWNVYFITVRSRPLTRTGGQRTDSHPRDRERAVCCERSSW